MLSWLLLAALILPGAARAEGERLAETFLSICADTFPDFAAMDAKAAALGGWLDPNPEKFSRVPFIWPDTAWVGTTGARDHIRDDDMKIERAKGTFSDLPAAGCEVTGRGKIDDAAMARLFGRLEPALYLGERGSSLMNSQTRSWLVQLDGQTAILAIIQPKMGGEIFATSIALVRLDETLIERWTAQGAAQ